MTEKVRTPYPTARERVLEAIKENLYTLSDDNLDWEMIERIKGGREMKLIEFVHLGQFVDDIMAVLQSSPTTAREKK